MTVEKTFFLISEFASKLRASKNFVVEKNYVKIHLNLCQLQYKYVEHVNTQASKVQM